MITSVYERQKYRLTVSGHAGYAEAGEDIVCAAVSVLVHTLAAAMERLVEQGVAECCGVQLGAGTAELQCTPAEGCGCQVHTIMDAVCLGMELLAKNYGAYVAYEMKEGEFDEKAL